MRRVILGAVIGLFVLGQATPVAAALPDVPMTPFAIWPPGYCGEGRGTWEDVDDPSGTIYYIQALTISRKDGCVNASPATQNTFAAYAKLRKRSSSGAFYTCNEAPHRVNPTGAWTVESDNIVGMDCGSGSYRLRAEWRITYGGQPRYGVGESTSRTCPCT